MSEKGSTVIVSSYNGHKETKYCEDIGGNLFCAGDRVVVGEAKEEH